MKTIQAIILDGFHQGHAIRVEYMPTIKLLKPRNLTVDYCCDNEITVNDPISSYVEYKEVFRAVDGDVVLYSEDGKSHDFIQMFKKREVTSKSWTEYTTIYFGYHSEPIVRKDDGTQKTEFDRGFDRGIEEGRIIQQKEFNKKLQ
jgi:hypothetical protein